MSDTPIIFLTVPYSLIRQGSAVTAVDKSTTGINILLDEDEIDLSLLLSFVKKIDYIFIFCIPGPALLRHDDGRFFAKLYTLATLSACFINSDYQLPVFCDTEADLTYQQNKLQGYFGSQGSNIKLIWFHPQYPAMREGILIATVQQFDQSLFEKHINDPITRMIIPFLDVNKLNSNMNELTKLTTQGYLFRLMSKKQGELQVKILQNQVFLWEERSKLYLLFISLSKQVGEKDYYDLKEWYQNEYEMLPLWYKRIGHMVNVLRGKRTFKSLYDENAKRYTTQKKKSGK